VGVITAGCHGYRAAQTAETSGDSASEGTAHLWTIAASLLHRVIGKWANYLHERRNVNESFDKQ